MQTIVNRRKRMLQIAAAIFSLVVFATAAPADIFKWEYIDPANLSQGKRQSTALALDGAGVDAVPGADLSNRNLTMAYLIGADLSGANGSFAILADGDLSQANLSNAVFGASTLTGASFRQANLANANFIASYPCQDVCFPSISYEFATLTDADFTDAEVRGASFGPLTLAQLYSTASYQAGDLSGIGLMGSDLNGGNFAGQNITNANFLGATLTDADFTGAQVRGANFWRIRTFESCGTTVSGCPFFRFIGTGITLEQLYSTSSYQERDIRGVAGIVDASIGETANLILPDGHVHGLGLNAGDSLTIRDYNGNATPIPITVDEHFTIGPGGTLRIVFGADAWDSTISFAPGIPVSLGGKLELAFADDVNLASQVGRTFDLFDWTGVTPTGAFTVSSPYHWNLSNLHTTGKVTLTAVPEPPSIALATAALGVFVFRRRRWQKSQVHAISIELIPGEIS